MRPLALLTALLALSLPAAAQTAPAPVTAQTVHEVVPGDSLFRIAGRYGVSVEAIRAANGIVGDLIRVGERLTIPAPGTVPAAPAPSAPAPAGLPSVGGVTVQAPARLTEGDGFVLRLWGARASEARVRFLSEEGEDVRRPAEVLTPFLAGDHHAVLGRVVLGKRTPVRFEVRVGDAVYTGSIPVGGSGLAVQHLNLPATTTAVLQDPARAAEDAAVNAAYEVRTPRAWTQPFIFPSTNRFVTSRFGQPRTYERGGRVSYHYGEDFRAPVGTPLRAMNDGTVLLAGMYPVRGGLVMVDHGEGLHTLFFHMSRVDVRPGDRVTRGQTVGLSGNTGLSGGPHLHLEVRLRGEAIDPNGIIDRLWPQPR